jgi:hypothetical protein
MIDKRARISRFLRDFYQIKASGRVWLQIVVTLVLLDATASAQGDTEDTLNGEPALEENRAEPSPASPEKKETAISGEATLDRADANRTDLTLSEFLFAIRVGPFFSFNLWTGLLGEIEFEFKLHSQGYLSLLSSFNGGYQIDFERGNYLFSEALGYRRYFSTYPGDAWTLFGGVSFGYFTTTQGKAVRSYDWLHIGLKAKGGYYFFTDESFSVGIDVGLTLAYQLDEFIGADSFIVLIPDLSVALLF